VAGALAALVSIAGCLAVSCGDPSSSAQGPSTAGLPALNLFARGVELDLAPYLAQLSAPPLGLGDRPNGGLARDVRTFYQRRQNQPAWFANGRPRAEAGQLIDFVAGLDAEALDSADYRPHELRRALDAASSGEPGARPEEVEVGLTWAALLAAADLRYGRVPPQLVEERWHVEREPIDLPAVLERALADDKLVETMGSLDPQHPQFAGLLQALARYRQIAHDGGWPRVPMGPVLRVGQKGDSGRLLALAERLRAEGFLDAVPPELASAPAGSKVPYTVELAEGVRRFQATRTLDADGSLGPDTQAELDAPLARRLRQIELNLERWRWVPDDFGERAVMVNLPGYRLDVVEGGRSVMAMRVVVGEEGWETPVFHDRIRYLVINPYWNVPKNLFQQDVMPAIERDPNYLAEHGLEVVDGERDNSPVVSPSRVWEVGTNGLRLRARPGEENPLGRVKFMFPNKYDIYLHDTPAAALFEDADRSASHGCIRLERPLDLADYLVRDDPKWNAGKIRAAIASGETQEVPLAKPVPVYLLYFTAAYQDDGHVAFFEDIYDIDRAHNQAWTAVASRRPGGATPAGEEEAVQQEARAEAAYVGPPSHAHGAAAWARRHRSGALEKLQGKPRQQP
jgi:murein L,D-transpeptidase YcbB/YkuD